MTADAPLIDPRDRDALAAQTAELAQRFSGWQPRPGAAPDAGQALIGVFARFAELVVARINQAPDRNYLAFLNLIGTEPLPPQPARVPLTFTLAAGGPAGALVPAGTQVAAPPLPGDSAEVVFSTEADLVVARSQLRAVVVGDTESDAWSDRFAEATGAVDAAFPAFVGDQPTPHELFLACDEVLTGPGVKDVTLVLEAPQYRPLKSWPISWAYWDGTTWQPATSTATANDGVWRVILARLPQLPPRDVGGITAAWVRARLDMGLPRGESGIPPESVATGARPPQDDAAGLYPFGETSPTKWFYLSADDAIATGGATVRLDIALSQAGVVANAATPIRLDWTYKVGSEWRELGRSGSDFAQFGATGFADTSQALTLDGTVMFPVPQQWPRELFRGRLGRWLRAELSDTGGGYATLPRLASLTASYAWDLPTLSTLTMTLDTPIAPVPVPSAFAESSRLDVSKDFVPFGDQPGFNQTCYLALPADLVRPGAPLALAVRLSNATDAPPLSAVRTDGRPGLVWEGWDGTAWQPVTVADPAYAFTADTTVQLTLPAGFAPTTVNGEPGCWLRIRLVRGDYGKAATYVETAAGYRPVPATFSAPVVRSLTVAPGSAEPTQLPVTACVSRDDFAYRTHRASAADPAAEFTPYAASTQVDPALYLGFDQPFDPVPVTLYLQVEPPAPEEVAADRFAEIDPATRAQLVWEYRGPAGWQPLDALDRTDGLSARAVVEFVGPPDAVADDLFDQHGFWLRLRWTRGEFAVVPRLRRVLLNTAWAVQAVTVDGEILCSGTGLPGQSATTAQTPLLPGQTLLVREPDAGGSAQETWSAWEQVPDFYSSGPTDRHYTADAVRGELRFGDGQAGRVLPAGQNNVRLTYRTGGGAPGNRAAQTIAALNSPVPYVDAVTNPEPAQGGYDREPIERLRARGPRVLRHRDRAVTAQDLEDVALSAASEVIRVRAVPPSQFNPYDLWLDPKAPQPSAAHAAADAGRFGVIVVPDSTAARPSPSLALLRQVQAHLADRCPLTAQLWVAGPEWIRVTVSATVAPQTPEQADAVATAVRAALERYLHPLTGGPGGTGWAFGRKPHRSEAFAVAEAVPGVDHVRSLAIELVPESDSLGGRLQTVLGRSLAQAAAQPPATDLQRWLDRALVYSGGHQITVTLRG